MGADLDGSLEDAHSGPGELDISFGKKDAIIIEVCMYDIVYKNIVLKVYIHEVVTVIHKK